MYSVSDSYKSALLENHITDSVEGTVILRDGTSIELSDDNIVSGSLRICHELCDDYKIGTFNLGTLYIGFFDDDALGRDFSGARITINYKLKTESGWEVIPMGVFIADGQSVVRRRNTITLTAYDYGILFDCTIGTTIRSMCSNAETIISAVCDRCGVVFGGIAEGLPNTEITITPSSERIQSCRDLIGWCASLLCGYAVIDRSGYLKIISARYEVDDEDPSEIIVDKLLTEAERNSIYSTDTRAWIAQMSAYSDGSQKIYRSNITRDDSQAARAVYYLENNPLTEGMSESLCDLINCNWLSFIDGFMQRGITAEIYGDPAIDTGDIIRCSGGDIDQRKSVVGLVTKQEWRYRDYHTVICAGAQLSDGIEGTQGDEDSDSEAQAVEDTDDIYPVKVISQSEKRAKTGEKYYAGEGLKLSDNVFHLKTASASGIGGLYMSAQATVPPEDGTTSDRDSGIYIRNEFPYLRRALNYQMGGIYLGDGLAPTVEESVSNGEAVYTNTGHVEVRIDEGLEFIENDETTEDVAEIRQNALGGRAIAAVRATTDKFGTVKLGKRMAIDGADGSVYPVMNGKDGIDVSDEGDISLLIDEEKLKIDSEGKLTTKGESGGLTVEQAVIIQEADASYLLHEYTEVKYIDGNRICYTGPESFIIIQGIVSYARGGTAPNGVKVAEVSSKEPDEFPDIPTYGSMLFGEMGVLDVSGDSRYVSGFEVSIREATSNFNEYRLAFKTATVDGGESTGTHGYTRNVYDNDCGVTFVWDSIFPPGTYEADTISKNFPYGYAVGRLFIKRKISSSYSYYSSNISTTDCALPFASEAEYNAAVGLTYEANTLTAVQETVTEV